MKTSLKQSSLELIRTLALAFGPSGCEDATAALIAAKAHKFGADTVTVDNLGNVIARIGSAHAKKRLLFTTGMDEIGFMITELSGKYLRVQGLGKTDHRALYGRRVKFGDDERQSPAIFGGKPLHLAEGGERNSADAAKLFLDPCLETEEQLKELARVGDYAAFDSTFQRIGPQEEYLICKALDVRCPCALLLETLQALKTDGLPEDTACYFVFAVKEQVSMSGAAAAAYAIAPTAAVSVGFAGDDRLGMEGCKPGAPGLGDGVFLPLLDGGVLYFDSPLRGKALSLAKEEGIPVREGRGDGNSAGKLHLTKDGIPTLRVELPCRNPHTDSVIVKTDDYLALRSLLWTLAKKL